MKLTKAGRAEILRAAQRDESFKEKLWSDASELLHLVGGVRLWIKYKEVVRVMGGLAYDLVTTGLNLQTLGEEFTGMVQVNRTGMAMPEKFVQILMILVKNCGEILLDGSLQTVKSWRKNHSMKESAVQKIFKILNILKILIPILGKTHKALFYLNGDYYDVTKRLFGIRYVLIRYWLKDRSSLPAFRILGIISFAYVLLHFMYSAVKLKDLDNDDDNKMPGNMLHEPVKVCDKCPLCLNMRQDTSVTPCGHLFCWSCIISWLQEQSKCPLCRQNVQPSRVVLLRNYSSPK